MSAPLLCQVISPSGPNGEPLACAYEPGHEGPHSWGSLPTFIHTQLTKAEARGQEGDGGLMKRPLNLDERIKEVLLIRSGDKNYSWTFEKHKVDPIKQLMSEVIMEVIGALPTYITSSRRELVNAPLASPDDPLGHELYISIPSSVVGQLFAKAKELGL